MIDEENTLFADETQEDEVFFADDLSNDNDKDTTQKSISPSHQLPDLSQREVWKVLIVDDESEIHNVTRFALSDYEYKGKRLHFLSAHTGEEAITMLRENQDVALTLLDVVMETNDAGLKVVERIRNELQNDFIRIIMRTGQPGQAPEEDVIIRYDINDYKNKTELTDKRLFTTITTGLRSYSDIMEIEGYRQHLEQKVKERTAEVVKAKEIIEKKNHEITSSINYAKRIQEAMLPYPEYIGRYLSDFFILFKPRDIVSGDFYWFSEGKGKIIISAVDCTGHGVPGAFMSMVGDANLKQIINAEGVTHPDLILNQLHERIRHSLKQAETQNRDGMDMAICTIDPQRQEMEFAGAKNHLVYLQAGEMKVLKGDRHPIGGEQKEEKRAFTRHVISLEASTTAYLFTDGFQDQFGGAEGRKFMVRKLRKLFQEIHHHPMARQQEILDQTFREWKGENRQTDDVLIIGFKIN